MADDVEKIKQELSLARVQAAVKDEQIARLVGEATQANIFQLKLSAREKDIEDLIHRNQELQNKIEVLMQERPKLSPDNLMAVFYNALDKMQAGLETASGKVDYTVSQFDTELKVAVTLDDEGKLAFQLLKVEDVLPSESMSILRFALRPTVKTTQPAVNLIEVPSLVGTTVEQAGEKIRAANFKAGKITERVSPSRVGLILEQMPDAYALAEAGTAIDLVVARSQDTQVPNLVGMVKDEALKAVTSRGLSAGKVTGEASGSPEGTIIAQSLEAGSMVLLGTIIDLVYAETQRVKVPLVTQMPLKQAKTVLQKALLQVGKVDEEPSQWPDGAVLKQNPQSGEEAPAQSAVDLVVSKQIQVAVPKLVGSMLESAEKKLKSAGLVVGKVVQRREKGRAGIVLTQEPEAGANVPVGSRVDLVIIAPL